ncbi:MAG: DNA-3-methyladenine glycosylase [Patescibacteria group bacterium]|nr:DNA-3-methyladenine glycosylase [Patescibacteria group bacterium]MDE1988492.1 DNA-3-methyladenine glycosylase [Patescibacteria group bacterium]MDE2218135.1 DNA-3-methyladenine glycosylase [Patescibacteria group bacterium]
MRKILGKKFFERDTFEAAEDLLGKYLVRRLGDKEIALKINEVEAYDGFEDKASHAHTGKTERNKVMFGEAGNLYVYLTYGMHNMLNIVTNKKDYPAAILIRGAGEINGPGRLTRFLKIDRKLNGKNTSVKTGLWFEDRGERANKRKTKRTARIGVGGAGPIWSEKDYRFILID